MIDLHEKYCEPDGEYCMMYYGTINGLFRQFPGVESSLSGSTYADYDPRYLLNKSVVYTITKIILLKTSIYQI